MVAKIVLRKGKVEKFGSKLVYDAHRSPLK
jgi:hypothetical protein